MTTARTSSLQKELTTLQTLQQQPASHYVPKLIDVLVHEGPNGRHTCIVTEMLGLSFDTVVADYQDGGDQLSPDDILRLAKQVLQAIACIHKVGYAHGAKSQTTRRGDTLPTKIRTVDISCANMVVTVSNLSLLSDDAFFDILGRPELADFLRKGRTPLGANLPKHLVRKAAWVEWTDEDEEDIRIADFGEAFLLGKALTRIAQPS